MNVEFHVLDVFDSLAPELKKFKTLKEAQEACSKLAKIKDEEEEQEEEISELRINLPTEASTPTEEDYERERQITHSKQEKQFDLELQALIQDSIHENASQTIQSRPAKLIKEKGDSSLNANPENTKEKKITLCLRVGNKVIPKNIFLNKDSSIAQRLTEKEMQEKETLEKAIEATKSLHQTDIKKSDEIQYEDLIGNSQIKFVTKKSYK